MVELPASMPRTRLDHRREMVRFVTPHRSDHGNLVDHAADVRKPVGNRNARLTIATKSALARNDGPAHLCQIVAEADDIDHLARPFIVLGIEGVDMADAAAHEKKDDGFHLGREMGAKEGIGDLAGFGPEAAQRDSQETAAYLMKELATRDSAARIKAAGVHRS